MNDSRPVPVPWLPSRLALYYIAYFVAVGIHLPFWPVWLSARGLDASAIGDIIAAGIVIRIILTPVVASLADRSGERKRIIAVLALLAFAVYLLYGWTFSFLAIMAVSVVFSPAWACGMPLAENMTMKASYRHGFDYGRVRLWGSVAFIVVSCLMGRYLVGRPPSAIYGLLAVALGFLVLASFLLPDIRTARTADKGRSPLRALLGDRTFLIFLGATAFIQSSHGLYYVMGTLHWQMAGYSDDVIGALWADGVVAEVLLFLFARRFVNRVDPALLIALGGVAGIVRWTATGASDSLVVLALAQALHGATYGVMHLGAMHYIARFVPASASATAQSLYSAIAMGMGIGTASFASGRLYESLGGDAYYAMAVLAAVGTAVAFVLRARPRSILT